jgi:hypothetical protein
VIEEGIKTSDFFGAYLTGSISHFSDSAKFPASSDVDISVILSRPDLSKKPPLLDALTSIEYRQGG